MADIGRKMVEIAQSAVASVSAKEVHDRVNANESLVFLDVREPDEWADGHIEKATTKRTVELSDVLVSASSQPISPADCAGR